MFSYLTVIGQGRNKFQTKVDIEVSQASGKAIDQIEANGGKIKLVYYNRVGLRYLLKPEKFKQPVYFSEPPVRLNNKLWRPMEQPDQVQESVKEEVREEEFQEENQ